MATTRTGASFRIRTDHGSARRVTEVLAIEPSEFFEIGDVRGRISPRVATHAMWSLRAAIDDQPLSDHLSKLCDQLLPVAPLLRELANVGYRMDWFCFVESGSQGSVQLDAALLRTLAQFPAMLTLDLYCGDDAEEDDAWTWKPAPRSSVAE